MYCASANLLLQIKVPDLCSCWTDRKIKEFKKKPKHFWLQLRVSTPVTFWCTLKLPRNRIKLQIYAIYSIISLSCLSSGFDGLNNQANKIWSQPFYCIYVCVCSSGRRLGHGPALICRWNFFPVMVLYCNCWEKCVVNSIMYAIYNELKYFYQHLSCKLSSFPVQNTVNHITITVF